MTIVAALLAGLCLVMGGLLALSLWERRRLGLTLATETTLALERWGAELKGRYDQMVAERERQVETLTRERDATQGLLRQWSERIAAIQEAMGRIDRQAIATVGDMATVLKPIVEAFRSPQVAGVAFGEAELELLLRTHLGEGLYVCQPRRLAVGGEVVDFAVTLPDCLVPIDSKFPSASYTAWVEAATEADARAAWRTFRNEMLEQIVQTAKYIQPEAGTTDYALLFVPSDVIYQQAFLATSVYGQDNPIPRRAQEARVFGCSTQTLLPYLGLIRLGLRNLKIADDVKGIRRQIEQLDVVFKTFNGDWQTLRGHVDRLAKHVEKLSETRGSVARLSDVVRKLTGPGRPGPTAELPAPTDPAAELAMMPMSPQGASHA
jgi:DNA recombination protein RmuC